MFLPGLGDELDGDPLRHVAKIAVQLIARQSQVQKTSHTLESPSTVPEASFPEVRLMWSDFWVPISPRQALGAPLTLGFVELVLKLPCHDVRTPRPENIHCGEPFENWCCVAS